MQLQVFSAVRCSHLVTTNFHHVMYVRDISHCHPWEWGERRFWHELRMKYFLCPRRRKMSSEFLISRWQRREKISERFFPREKFLQIALSKIWFVCIWAYVDLYMFLMSVWKFDNLLMWNFNPNFNCEFLKRDNAPQFTLSWHQLHFPSFIAQNSFSFNFSQDKYNKTTWPGG